MKTNPSKLPLILLLTICCAGCAFTGTTPATRVYTLGAAPVTTISGAQQSNQRQSTLKLGAMRGTHALSSNKIIYSDDSYGQNGYLYSHWSDAPVVLLRQLFQRAMEQNHLVGAVLPINSSARADYLLESTLYDCSQHIFADKTSAGVIRIRFYLIDNNQKTVIATREFSATVKAPSTDAKGGVTALNGAARQIVNNLNEWLQGNLQQGVTQ